MIRDFEPSDQSALADIHRDMGLDYRLPDLGSPLFVVKKVREVDGRVTGALLMRISCETMLLCSGSPREKAEAILELQPEALKQAWDKGVDDVFCVVPPELETSFLEHMGWSKDRPWPMWSRSTGA